MNKYIAYCGLDCEKCEARIATVNNDDSLREKVAKEWSELNKVTITKDNYNDYLTNSYLDTTKSRKNNISITLAITLTLLLISMVIK